MSERAAPGAMSRGLIATAGILLGSVGLASAALGCTAVAPQVVLCTEGTEWAQVDPQHHGATVAWEGEDFWLEFNDDMTQAVVALGGDGAALDAVIATSIQIDGATGTQQVLRDRFTTDRALVERAIVRMGNGGETYLTAILLVAFADAGPRLVWSMGSFDDVSVEDLQGVIETAAGALRPGTEN